MEEREFELSLVSFLGLLRRLRSQGGFWAFKRDITLKIQKHKKQKQKQKNGICILFIYLFLFTRPVNLVHF